MLHLSRDSNKLVDCTNNTPEMFIICNQCHKEIVLFERWEKIQGGFTRGARIEKEEDAPVVGDVFYLV